jgi:single-strand DNA-binding protein
MEQITGRLISDAEVRTTKRQKKVVAFTLVINRRYKKKGATGYEYKSVFFNCSYWLTTEIANYLKKGTIVTVFGNIELNQYKTKDGEHRANLAFHVNTIEFIAKGQKQEAGTPAPTVNVPF